MLEMYPRGVAKHYYREALRASPQAVLTVCDFTLS